MTSMSSISAIFAAGGCFMLANLALKVFDDKPFYILYGAAGAALLGGCVFQALAFRGAQFGLAVVLILGLEMLFSILVAGAFLGDVLMVITGMGLVHIPAAAEPEHKHAVETLPTVDVKKGPRPIASADEER